MNSACRATATAICSMLALASSALAQSPGDECANAIQLSGGTVILYDPTVYTTSQDPFASDPGQCFPVGANSSFVRDAWYCWTADCSGMLTVDACTPATGGTRMAMWIGCGCPDAVPPFCCSDAACGQNAAIVCEVVCGQQYLFRFGTDPGTAPVARTISFMCSGAPCPPPPPPPAGPPSQCESCCEGAPAVSHFAGRPVLLSTDSGDASPSKVLHVFDASGTSAPGNGPLVPPRYEHPSWTQQNLGTVFGVTADGGGDIYLSHFSFYRIGQGAGTLTNIAGTTGGMGAVTRIDGATGTATVLVSLPQSTSAPGLGNITWSCAHHSLYVTNFEDGRVYRIDPAAPAGSRVVSAWDFATDTLASGGAPEAGDAPGMVPVGERVWGIAVGSDRMFVAQWNQSQNEAGVGSNKIWSVRLDAAGDPVPGTKTIEIDLAGQTKTSPVADLAFDADCCLYAAERSLPIDPTLNAGPFAHASSLLKFCWQAPSGGAPGAWVASGSFAVGMVPPFDNSAAGGVGVDNASGGRVWTTGDYLWEPLPSLVYGMAGFPQSGGTSADYYAIDNDGEMVANDKKQIGSCEVICQTVPRCTAETVSILCDTGDGIPPAIPGQYTWKIRITNNSGVPVSWLLFPNPNISTPYVDLTANPIPDGGSRVVSVTLHNAPLEGVCTSIILADASVNECCSLEVCVDVPDCDCGQVTDWIAFGGAPMTTFALTLTYQNLAVYPVQHLFLLPIAPSGMTVVPAYIHLSAPLAPGATITLPAVQVTLPGPPQPGDLTRIQITQHTPDLLQCCSEIFTIRWSNADGDLGGSPPVADLNGDGLVNGADIGILLGQWGGPGSADLNRDGTVNGSDLGMLLGQWS